MRPFPHLSSVLGCLLLGLGMSSAVAAEALNTRAAVQQAIDDAKPGDEILLAEGEFDGWHLNIPCSGTAEAPITIRPQSPGTAIFTGSSEFTVTGDHVILRDLVFQNVTPEPRHSVIRFDHASHSRVTATEFRHSRMESGRAVVAIAGVANDCRVDHCRFIDSRFRSIRIIIDDGSLKNGPPLRTRIDHNIFRDISSKGSNGGETIQFGSRAYPYSALETHAVVEENVFLRCNGEAEIISDKTSANTFRGNVFLQCRGELVMRHGNRSTIADNRFIDCAGGIRISGSGHSVTGNTIVNSSRTGIRLYYGVEDEKHPAAYLPVTGCRIEGNKIIHAKQAAILVGDNRNARWHSERWADPPYNASADLAATVPPAGNTITGNMLIGPVDRAIVIDHAPDNEITENFLFDPAEPAN